MNQRQRACAWQPSADQPARQRGETRRPGAKLGAQLLPRVRQLRIQRERRPGRILRDTRDPAANLRVVDEDGERSAGRQEMQVGRSMAGEARGRYARGHGTPAPTAKVAGNMKISGLPRPHGGGPERSNDGRGEPPLSSGGFGGETPPEPPSMGGVVSATPTAPPVLELPSTAARSK